MGASLRRCRGCRRPDPYGAPPGVNPDDEHALDVDPDQSPSRSAGSVRGRFALSVAGPAGVAHGAGELDGSQVLYRRCSGRRRTAGRCLRRLLRRLTNVRRPRRRLPGVLRMRWRRGCANFWPSSHLCLLNGLSSSRGRGHAAARRGHGVRPLSKRCAGERPVPAAEAGASNRATVGVGQRPSGQRLWTPARRAGLGRAATAGQPSRVLLADSGAGSPQFGQRSVA